MKRVGFLLPLLTATYLFAFATPPVYPGAKAVDQLNEAAKKAGQNTMAYKTLDSFEKVYDFYKSKGTEEQRAHRISAREKFAMIVFKDDGYTVTMSWKEDAKSSGTVIHVAEGRRRPIKHQRSIVTRGRRDGRRDSRPGVHE